MVDALRKLLLAGLGTLDLTEEKARAVFNDLVARGEMSEKDARDLVSSWAKRAGEQRDRLQRDIDQAVNKTMTAMGLARRAEMDALAAKVAELERKLSGEPPAPPTATATTDDPVI
jgi:poly(hydroxyalkanoate) granule-associated protein